MVSLACSVLTSGEVMWIVRVMMDLVLVTAMAASPGHWLTVYVPAELSYLKEEDNVTKRLLKRLGKKKNK